MSYCRRAVDVILCAHCTLFIVMRVKMAHITHEYDVAWPFIVVSKTHTRTHPNRCNCSHISYMPVCSVLIAMRRRKAPKRPKIKYFFCAAQPDFFCGWIDTKQPNWLCATTPWIHTATIQNRHMNAFFATGNERSVVHARCTSNRRCENKLQQMPGAHTKNEWQKTIGDGGGGGGMSTIRHTDGLHTKIIVTHAKRWEKIGDRHAKNVQKLFWRPATALGRLKIYFRLFYFRSHRSNDGSKWKLYYLRQREMGWETTKRREMQCSAHCASCVLYYVLSHYRNYQHILMFSAFVARTSLLGPNEWTNDRLVGRSIDRSDGRKSVIWEK